MITLMNKRAKNKKGFTLIELLVVLAILAIIALIAVPNFLNVRSGAEADADTETINMVEKALELMVVAENMSVTDGQELCRISNANINTFTSPATDALVGKYVSISDSKTQVNGAIYKFNVDSSGNVTGTLVTP